MIDKQWLHTLSRQLQVVYGRGFSAKNLRHMIRFAEVFADEDIVSTLWRQLSWSHFKEIIYQKDALQRDFYAEMCRVERWSVRTLRPAPLIFCLFPFTFCLNSP